MDKGKKKVLVPINQQNFVRKPESTIDVARTVISPLQFLKQKIMTVVPVERQVVGLRPLPSIPNRARVP